MAKTVAPDDAAETAKTVTLDEGPEAVIEALKETVADFRARIQLLEKVVLGPANVGA